MSGVVAKVWLCTVLEEPAGVVHPGVGITREGALEDALRHMRPGARATAEAKIAGRPDSVTHYSRRDLR